MIEKICKSYSSVGVELYKDESRSITWSSFAHTAQANYVHARIALQSTSPPIGVSLSHQMVELFVKAFILHDVLDGDYEKFDAIRKNFGHNTSKLLRKYQNDIPVFGELLGDKVAFQFIDTVQEFYLDARFGQLHSMNSP